MGKTPQPGAPERPQHPSAVFDLLEQTVSLEGPVPGPRDTDGLDPVSIPSDWVIEGEPRAREKPLANSTDGAARVFLWDCSSGRFHWDYAAEEIVHVVQGCAIVETVGVSRRLQRGDTLVFPSGSRFRWSVPDYVRAVRFRLRAPAGGTFRRRIQAAFTAPWRARRIRSP